MWTGPLYLKRSSLQAMPEAITVERVKAGVLSINLCMHIRIMQSVIFCTQNTCEERNVLLK